MTPRLLHVWVLSAFAVAQPIYDVIRRNGEFFVAHEADRLDLILLTVALSILLPGLVAAIVWVAGRVHRRAGAAAMLVAVAAFCALIALQAFRAANLDLNKEFSFAGAALIGAGAAWLYARAAAVQQLLTVLSPAVVIFPVLFLASGGVRAIMAPPPPPQDAVAGVTGDTPVVFVVFDQLPLVSLLGADGHVDATAFPSFAALERDALWFRNATTVADLTGWALPAIVSGEFPVEGKLPVTADHPRNLFTMLSDRYAMEVVEPITKLCPRSLCASESDPRLVRQASMLSDLSIVYPRIFLPAELAAALPPLTNNWRDFAQDNTDWRRRWVRQRDRDRRQPPQEFVERIESSDGQPTLYFLHALLPHEPYVYTAGGVQITDDTVLAGLSEGRWTGDAWTVSQAYRQHLLQVQYVDSILGSLIARLREQGLYDRALIVVTADHGVAFTPRRPFKAIMDSTIPTIVPVPLFIKRPFSQGGEISDRNVQSVDVLPTVAEILGARLPWTPAGRSAIGSAPAPDDKTLYYNGARDRRTLPGSMRALVDDFVGRKLALFGPSTPGGVFTPLARPVPELLDRPVSELTVGAPSPLRLRLIERFRFEDVDPASDFVPARFTGRVLGERGASRRWPLAIAVNGVVRATTWSVGRAIPQIGHFAAIVRPDVFVRGRNTIEIYQIETREGSVVLRPAFGGGVRPKELNLAGAEGIDWGVEEEGVYPLEPGPTPLRWTNGQAALSIDMEEGAAPIGLQVALAPPARRTDLTISVNGCTVFDGTVPGGAWERTLSLSGCRRDLFEDGQARIEIRSGTFTPPSNDTRTLGVPLTLLRLKMGTDPVS